MVPFGERALQDRGKLQNGFSQSKRNQYIYRIMTFYVNAFKRTVFERKPFNIKKIYRRPKETIKFYLDGF